MNQMQVTIDTPNGKYYTSQELAHSLEQFYDKTKRMRTGVCGGQYSFTFVPTSMGVILVIKDSFSNESIDVTDYAKW
jgi:hypothetical protein